MVKRQRNLLVALGGVVVLSVVYLVFGGDKRPAAAPPAGGERGARASVEPELPRVGLERVQPAYARSSGGAQRDVFDFGREPRPEPVVDPRASQPAPEPTPTPVPTPTPLPVLNVKYIGSLEKKGLKVAFFMTEKKEVLSGQAGETVMNRFRVVRIGLESVDVQQVGADQVQRLPLKGN
jgi:hypothetical protein